VLLIIGLSCAPVPTSIDLDGPAEVVVHSTEPFDLPHATVLDAEGLPIEPQPSLTWSVSPASVGSIEGATVVPSTDGQASVVVRSAPALEASFALVVALPDAVRVGGYRIGQPFEIGEELQLSAALWAGDVEVPGVSCRWSSDSPSVVAVSSAGLLSARADGVAVVTCTSDELSASVEVATGTSVRSPRELLDAAISSCQSHTRKAVSRQLQQMISPSGIQAMSLRKETAAAAEAKQKALLLLTLVDDADTELRESVEDCDEG
jgi:hypothetical protein